MVGLVASGPEVETFVLGKMAFDGPDMRRDTIFRVASMTKPVTATAVMMLVEDGKLRLDEPVDRLLPELANRRVLRWIDAALDDTVPARRPITVEDLLTFRCGHGLILAPPGRYPIQKAIADLGIFGPPDRALPMEVDAWMSSAACRSLRSRGKTGCTGRARTSRGSWWRGRRASRCRAFAKNESLGRWG